MHSDMQNAFRHTKMHSHIKNALCIQTYQQMYSGIPNCIQAHQTVFRHTKLYSGTPKCNQTHQKMHSDTKILSDTSKMHSDTPECIQAHQNAFRHTRMHSGTQECIDIPKSIQTLQTLECIRVILFVLSYLSETWDYCSILHSSEFAMPMVMETEMSLVMRKQAFCISENKDADQLRSNCTADQHLCFHYTDSIIPLLPKSEISNL